MKVPHFKSNSVLMEFHVTSNHILIEREIESHTPIENCVICIKQKINPSPYAHTFSFACTLNLWINILLLALGLCGNYELRKLRQFHIFLSVRISETCYSWIDSILHSKEIIIEILFLQVEVRNAGS